MLIVTYLLVLAVQPLLSKGFSCETESADECSSNACYYSLDKSCVVKGCASEELCKNRSNGECFQNKENKQICCCNTPGCLSQITKLPTCTSLKNSTADAQKAQTQALPAVTERQVKATPPASDLSTRKPITAVPKTETTLPSRVPEPTTHRTIATSETSLSEEEEEEIIEHLVPSIQLVEDTTEIVSTTYLEETTAQESTTDKTPQPTTTAVPTTMVTTQTRKPSTEPTRLETTTTRLPTTVSETTTQTPTTKPSSTESTTVTTTTEVVSSTANLEKLHALRVAALLPPQSEEELKEEKNILPTDDEIIMAKQQTNKKDEHSNVPQQQHKEDVTEATISLTTSPVQNRNSSDSSTAAAIPWWSAALLGLIVSIVVAWIVVIILKKRRSRETNSTRGKSNVENNDASLPLVVKKVNEEQLNQ